MKQKTIKVTLEDGTVDVIKMKLRTVTRCGNPMGKKVKVNDKEYFINTLYNDEAFEKAYVKYIKEER